MRTSGPGLLLTPDSDPALGHPQPLLSPAVRGCAGRCGEPPAGTTATTANDSTGHHQRTIATSSRDDPG